MNPSKVSRDDPKIPVLYHERVLPVALRPLLALLLLLAGCAPSFQSTAVQAPYSGPLTPRPDGSPDVLILAMSGRCPCLSAPVNNVDYLMPRGTVKAVASAFESRGLSVQSAGAAAHLTSHLPTTAIQSQLGQGVTVAPPQEGFLQMEARLVTADREWIVGRSNPTRIVLLAHSHGVVWTHALARAHPDVPISLMIDLDGVCDMWELDNRQMIRDYVRQLGHNPWPFDLSNSCGSVRVGQMRYDLKDVVYPNVAQDLEVQSQRLVSVAGGFKTNFPFDALSNIRSDGSRTGIQTFRSRDTHSNVSMPGGEALAWIKNRLLEMVTSWQSGLPAAQTAP